MRADQDLLYWLMAMPDVERTKLQIEEKEQAYEVACYLSGGPDKDRAAYWTFKAKLMERELRQLCDY